MDGYMISLDLVRILGKNLREQLRDDALRGIRKKDLDEGTACLARIDGIEMFQRALDATVFSAIYRQNGDIVDVPALPALPAPVKKRSLPPAHPAVRPRVRKADVSR